MLPTGTLVDRLRAWEHCQKQDQVSDTQILAGKSYMSAPTYFQLKVGRCAFFLR